MTRPFPTIKAALVAALCVVAMTVILGESGALNQDIIERTEPLKHPLLVTGSVDGLLRLSDNRTFRPAGVRRRSAIAPADFDRALRAATAQGVTIIRDLDDGRAFLMVEPYFHNSCGTRGYKGNPWARWAGSYVQRPLSELLVGLAYAESEPDQAGLTARERWRLEAAVYLSGPTAEPVETGSTGVSIRWTSVCGHSHSSFDDMLEAVSGLPPPP